MGKDRIGERIQAHILKLLEKFPEKGLAQRIAEFVRDELFFCPNIKTIESTIVVLPNGQRTIISEEPVNFGEFEEYLQRRINQLNRDFSDFRIGAVMIGHIYSDNAHYNAERAGATTRYLLEKFDGRFIFTNFGQSQIGLGWETKREMMKQISVFQLSMTEIKAFFSEVSNDHLPLEKIIKSFKEQFNKTSAVITLDQFGAIAVSCDRVGGIYFAKPNEVLQEIEDSTGAGDAFGAGFVANQYCGKKDFMSALEDAQVWAAYACTTLGGAHECPNPLQLKDFKEHYIVNNQEEIQVEYHSMNTLRRELWILDRIYKPSVDLNKAQVSSK